MREVLEMGERLLPMARVVGDESPELAGVALLERIIEDAEQRWVGLRKRLE